MEQRDDAMLMSKEESESDSIHYVIFLWFLHFLRGNHKGPGRIMGKCEDSNFDKISTLASFHYFSVLENWNSSVESLFVLQLSFNHQNEIFFSSYKGMTNTDTSAFNLILQRHDRHWHEDFNGEMLIILKCQRIIFKIIHAQVI